MPIVEKNDVDIKPLFSWNRELEILLDGEEEPRKVYMRVLGDADMGRARVAALRRSAELRRKLKDENSDERLAFIRDIDDLTEELLISLITVFSMKSLSEKATAKLQMKFPKPPKSDAKTEAHEKYQAEVDAFPKKRYDAIKKLLEAEVDNLKIELSKESKESLYTKYVVSLIDELCEQELLSSFRDWCCYLGSYSDEKLQTKFFSSFEEFINLPSELKKQFIDEYSALELYGEDLKKLQRVTP